MKQLSLVCIITFIIFSVNLNSSITHIWPSSGTNNGTIQVKIHGIGFNSGVTSVELQKSGYPSIYAEAINVQSNNYLTCYFDLTGKSTTTYNLVINSDTLDMCFAVIPIYFEIYWDKTYLGGYKIVKIAIGDGNNDGEIEVYGVQDRIYQLKWNGLCWETITFGTYGCKAVAVGDGNNDGNFEVYGANYNGHIYQYTWNGEIWNEIDLGGSISYMYGVAVGDGNNDGNFEVYGACYDHHIYKFSWNGSSWEKSDVGYGGDAIKEVAIGDGNNDGNFEVYGASRDYHIYQFIWSGTNWDKYDLGSGSGFMNDVKVGDDNDGLNEVYAGCGDQKIYQFKWLGNTWIRTELCSQLGNMYGLDIGDGNSDGQIEVYGASKYNLYQFNWNGTSWDMNDIGSGNHWMMDLEIGDGDNNGLLDIYCSEWWSGLYRFQIIPNYLSDRIIEFFIIPSDTTVKNFYIKNVSNQDLSIDSVSIPLSEYSLINYILPDTISIGDSSLIDILFRSDTIGYFPCSIRIYTNDLFFEIQYIYLHGICDTILPTRVDLISPENGGYSNNTINFFWHPSCDTIGIHNYKLQHALDSNFTISLSEYNNVDTSLYVPYLPDTVYYWKVKAFNNIGMESPWSDVWSFTVDHLGIEEEVNITNGFRFSFASFSRDRSIFRFSIPELSDISLKIYDITGREVSELISGQYQPGSHEIPFNPERSGMYFYRLESKFLNETGKFTILR